MPVTPTLYASGTQTAVIGTEHTLSSVTAAGVFTFEIDTINMAAGDVLVLKIYKIILTGGVSRILYEMNYYGVQPTDDVIKVSLPVGNDLTDTNSLKYTLTQTFGTGKNYPWKVLQY